MKNQLSRSAQYKNINRITTKHFSKIPITVRDGSLYKGARARGSLLGGGAGLGAGDTLNKFEHVWGKGYSGEVQVKQV